MLPIADVGDCVCNIANDGSLNLDRLACDSQHGMAREMAGSYLFSIFDSHVTLFQTGPHKSTVSQRVCVVKKTRGMYDIFSEEFFDANQVALRPQFECRVTDINKGQLGGCEGECRG